MLDQAQAAGGCSMLARMQPSPDPFAKRIRAITLDLDDTLWPVWPAIERAEQVLLDWLRSEAPATAAVFSSTSALRAIRVQVERDRPDLRHDLSGLRRESIRLALQQSGDDPALADPAFALFFAMRQKVDLFEDALPALEFLAARWPVVALSNGNANVHTIGIGRFFKASLNVQTEGVAKPDLRMFQAGAAAAGVPLDQVLHVGDDAALDAQGALDAGMHAAWLNRGGLDWPGAGARPHATVASLQQLCEVLAG